MTRRLAATIADALNHTVTPVLVGTFWLFLVDRGQLRWSAPLKWALLPLAYFPYGLVRGWSEGTYPYPFMDLHRSDGPARWSIRWSVGPPIALGCPFLTTMMV